MLGLQVPEEEMVLGADVEEVFDEQSWSLATWGGGAVFT